MTVIDRDGRRTTFDSGTKTALGELGDLAILDDSGAVVGRVHPAVWSFVGGSRMN